MSHSKPNIIFLMTDQQRWDCIGKYNSHIRTPTLDRLADEGIVFGQAVCQAPMCVPSRSSLMFGLYPSQLGVRTNQDGLYEEDRLPVPPLPEVLRQAGYQTAGFGKTHWNHGLRTSAPSARGFETRAIGLARDSGHYEENALMMDEDDPAGLKAYYEETRHYGSGEENALGYIGRTSAVPMHQHRDGWVAEQCKKFIADGLDASRPLFLYLSFLKPHAGFNVPKAFEDLYRLEDIPDIEQPPWRAEHGTHMEEADGSPGSGGKHWERKQAWEQLSVMERRRTTLRYWANCTWLDHYFGQVLDGLQAKGVLDNALIVFVSDHGEMLGERSFRFSKYCLFESSVRVPLILSGSWIPQEKRGRVDDRPAELTDLVPTLMKAAGVPRNPLLPGLDLLSDIQRTGAFCEFHRKTDAGLFAAPSVMWRKQDWKLILYLPGPLKDAASRLGELKGELYHLQEDPGEWVNLYDDSRWLALRERMTAELLMHLVCTWTRGPFFYDLKGLQALGDSETKR